MRHILTPTLYLVQILNVEINVHGLWLAFIHQIHSRVYMTQNPITGLVQLWLDYKNACFTLVGLKLNQIGFLIVE